ncbi:MAG: hypothetical protein CMP51_01765 [Flavobacteriales bacterium]|nr:hypothetical protein [Flavobacteriales bacterium]
MKKTLLIFFIFTTSIICSQQAIMFSQYYINDYIYNPAITGSKNFNPWTLQTRQQWLGFEGAPLTANLSYHGLLNNRSAMGGYLEHDRTSPSHHSSFQLSYAYHVPLDGKNTFLSLGVGAKIMYYYLDFLPEDIQAEYDPAYNSKAYESFLGDANSGVYLYSDNFFIGYSVINLLQSSFNEEAGYGFSKNFEERIYYGIIGYQFHIDRDWIIEPSSLIRNLDNSYREYNFTTRVIYSDQMWAAASIRSNSSFSFAIGTNSDKVRFGYSFDYYYGEIRNYQNGTHEITISHLIPSYKRY